MRIVLRILTPLASVLIINISLHAQQGTFTDVSTAAGITVSSTYGAAMNDYNNDGYLDIFVADNAGPNVLYRNLGGDSFESVASGLGLASTEISRAGSWADYDNDGDLDLFVANYGVPRLYRNDGSIFSDVELDPTASYNAYCSAWADYDKDGDLDLFVGNFNGQDRLYRNDRLDGFTEVAAAAGISSFGHTRVAIWADYDKDRDLDLFIGRGATFANNTDALYRNDNGVFVDVTDTVGLGGYNTTIGAAWGDFDHDRDLDLFISSWDGEANHLYRNDRGAGFTDVAVELGLADLSGCLSASWVDYDNDRDLDLFISRTQDLGPLLYRNNRIQFSEVQDSVGLGSNISIVGHSWGDYDRDGDLDLFLPARYTANQLFSNNMDGACNWLHVKVNGGSATSRDATGVTVTVYAGELAQYREISGGQGPSTQNTLLEEFGLDDIVMADSVVVDWINSATKTVFTNVSANQVLVVDEVLTDVSPAIGVPDAFELRPNYPNPFNPGTTFSYSLGQQARVTLSIYNILGQRVRTLVKEQQTTGSYQVDWHGLNDSGAQVASGVYIVDFRAESYRKTMQIMLLK